MAGKLSFENYVNIAQYAIDSGLVGKRVEVDAAAAQVAVHIIREQGRSENPRVSILPNPDYVKYVIETYETAQEAIKKCRKLEKLGRDRMILASY